MKTELPEPWATALAPKGIHSYRDFGTAAGIAHETARRLCTGGSTSAATVNKVAEALFAGDSTQVWALYGEPLEDFGPWVLPPEARLLTKEQREAVTAVVMAMVPKQAKRGGGDGDADKDSGSSAPMKLRDVGPHEVDLAAYDPEG